MTRVLVTGAGGFIGQHLVCRLKECGIRVRALLHHKPLHHKDDHHVEFVTGDICDPKEMKKASEGCQAIIHLAGRVHAGFEGQEEEGLCWALNVDGTRNMLDGAVAQGVGRFLYVSTVKVFGEGGDACLDETSKPSPITPYGKSKYRAEHLVMEYGARTALKVTCLRVPPVYGSGHKGNLQSMVSAIDRGWVPPLPPIQNHRSLLSINNLLSAMMLAIAQEGSVGQCYIVTDARPYSMTEIYEEICSALGRPVPRWRVPVHVLTMAGRMGDVLQAVLRRPMPCESRTINTLLNTEWYSPKKIIQELGYAPTWSLQTDLPDLIAWWRTVKVGR